MDRFMKALDAMTFDSLVVACLVVFGACVAPSATLFLLLGHFRNLEKMDAAVLFLFGLAIDMFRYAYFERRSSATKVESDKKVVAAKTAVELEKRKKKAAEPASPAAHEGEIRAVATADKSRD